MLNLTRCSACAGFVPMLSLSCPHCGAAALGKIAKVATGTILGSAVSVTLMACYGCPPEGCATGYDGGASSSSSGGSSSSSSSSSGSSGTADAGDAATDARSDAASDGGGDAESDADIGDAAGD